MNRRNVRAHRMLLVAFLCLAVAAQPARALLSEAVVGVTLAVEALGVLAVLLPQVAALGTSVVTVAQSGREVFDTTQRLIQMVFGSSSKPASKDAKKPGSKSVGPVVVPTISGPTDKVTLDVPVVSGTDASLAGSLPSLIRAYHHEKVRASSIRVPTLDQGDSAGYDQLAQQLTGKLLEAVNDGDQKAVKGFVAAVKALPSADRAAVEPVVSVALKKGGRFGSLHQDDDVTCTSAFSEIRSLSSTQSGPSKR